jgi:hypothetical protein
VTLLVRPSGASRTVVGRSAVIALGVVGALLTLGAWLLASPPGSSPDDHYHLGSIWCGRGFQDDRCLPASGAPDANFALVPAPIGSINCYAYDSGARTAACLSTVLPGRPGEFAMVDTNIRRTRANLYYSTMHPLISDASVETTIARIRVTNAVTALGMVLLTALLATPRIRVALLITWVVASVPLGLFMVTSVNTTAWGITGLGTFWANTLTALHRGHPLRRALAGLLATVGVAMSVGARTEALPQLAFVALAVLLIAALSGGAWGRRALDRFTGSGLTVRLAAVAGAVLVGTLLWRFAPTRMFPSGFSEFQDGWTRLAERDIGNPLFAILLELPSFWAGILGSWNLGWLDTRLPASTSVLAIAVYASLLAYGLQRASRARIAAASTVLVSMIVLPVVALIPIAMVVNESIQARHFIALIYVLLGVALVRTDDEPEFTIGAGSHHTMAIALGLAHSAALWTNIGRYTIGMKFNQFVRVGTEPEWWWPSGPSPFTVWAVGSLAFLVVAYVGLSTARGPVSDAAGTSRR